MSDTQLSIGQEHHKSGRLDEAENMYRGILAENPRNARALFLLGQLLQQRGRWGESIETLTAAVEVEPGFAEAHHQLGIARQNCRDISGAMDCFRRALELRPRYVWALNSLGVAQEIAGDYAKAMESFRAALEIQGDLFEAMTNLGSLLTASGEEKEAMELLSRSVRQRPEDPGAHNNYGVVLQQTGRLDEAIAAFTRAIQLKGDFSDAFSNLGNVLKDAGRSGEAVAYIRRAVEMQPGRAVWHSNLIAALNYAELESPEILRRELSAWNERHAKPLGQTILPHRNVRDPERRLKIGYVSPDFVSHPVGRFLLPLFAHHDHGRYEIVAYSDVHWPDEMTERLRSQVDLWRDDRGVADAQLAERIREDGIDILVDLSLHTAMNRLLVFARKPAPVQVTYLAYPGSTGMTAVDYRLTDPYLDPPGGEERCYSERSVRLPHTFWCYEPMHTLDVGPLPAESAGVVTFASFNNFSKVSAGAWGIWRRVLQAVPRSRLVLSSPFGSHRDRLRRELSGDGINPDRLSFAPTVSTLEYFQNYRQADIALDPFPFGGGTTTCDALWMGVPVVTLRGSTAVGRGGASILSNVGLPELIADSAEGYIAAAKKLAEDLPRLSQIRRNLRAQMQGSPLMDVERFARDVEAAFRRMWIDWCRGAGDE